MVLRNLLFATVAVCALLNSCSAQNATYPTAYYTSLMTTDVLVNADLFDPEPKIMSAKYAFEGIKGVPNGTIESYARAAGGTWNTVPSECSNSTNVGLFTTVADPNTVAQCWGYPINDYADAMPVVFSWPVLPSTVQPTDFNLTLNTGEVVHPEVAAVRCLPHKPEVDCHSFMALRLYQHFQILNRPLIFFMQLCPNLEYNERQTVVIFGKMGNRIDPSDPGAQYVTKVEIVDDGTPLQLVGPGGKLHSAVGMTYNSSCCIPYGKNAKGPGLVAAKLSVFSDAGEGPVSLSPGVLPNACSDMYGPTDYRLRLYTSGGFSPDGVSAMFPTDYAKYFRVHVDLGNGTLMLNDTGVEYPVPRAGSLTIMGEYRMKEWV